MGLSKTDIITSRVTFPGVGGHVLREHLTVGMYVNLFKP